MSIKIVGHWERGWDTPWQEYNWWIHPLREFGVEEFYMSPITGIGHSAVHEFKDLKPFLDSPENDNYTRVYVDENADTSLPDFVHPENALYIFGRTSYDVIVNKRPEDLGVKIPTVKNGGGFWAHQAASLLLYDRFLKS